MELVEVVEASLEEELTFMLELVEVLAI